MKVESKKTQKLLAVVLGIVAVFMVGRALLSTNTGSATGAAPAQSAPKAKTAAPAPESLDPRLHLDLLANSESVVYEGQGRNIFRSGPEAEIPPVAVSPLLRNQHGAAIPNAALPPPGPPQPPPPPPINLKFFGYTTSGGDKPKAFLSQGDEVWIAHEGDVVNRQYKIVRITPSAVEVEDLLNNNRQSLRLNQG